MRLLLFMCLLLPVTAEVTAEEGRPPKEPEVTLEEWGQLPLSLKEQLGRDCVEAQAKAVLHHAEPTDLASLRYRLRHPDTLIQLAVSLHRPVLARIAANFWLRNLHSQGGILSGIQLFVTLHDHGALQLAQNLSSRYPTEVEVVQSDKKDPDPTWTWLLLRKPGVLYIRVDDDVVFLEDGALEMLAARALLHPRKPPWLMLSGNVLNGNRSPFIQSRLNPRLDEPLPPYIGDSHCNATVVMQQHEAFLEACSTDAGPGKFRFAGVWDFSACRIPDSMVASVDHGGQPPWSLHLIAFRGDDLPQSWHMGRASHFMSFREYIEHHLTSVRPRETHRPGALVGQALAVSLGFRCLGVAEGEREVLLRRYTERATTYCSVPLRATL